MSYGPSQRSSTGETPQSLPHPARALFVIFRSSAAARAGILHLFAASLSLCEASPAPQRPCHGHAAQDRLHREVARPAGSPAPSLCRPHSTHFERGRQPSLSSDAQPRAEAWLKRGHPGRRAWFISNINWTVCLLPNSHKCTNCWCPTNDGSLATRRR
jgi:hypothetical protein